MFQNEIDELNATHWGNYNAKESSVPDTLVEVVEGCGRWLTDVVSVAKTHLDLKVVAKIPLKPDHTLDVGGSVVNVAPLRFPKTYKDGIFLGNNHWLIPSDEDKFEGTDLLKPCGAIFEMKRTFQREEANCEIQKDSNGKLILKTSREMRVGEPFVLFIERTELLADKLFYNAVKNMSELLCEMEDDAWKEGFSVDYQLVVVLMKEFFSNVKSFVGVFKFRTMFLEKNGGGRNKFTLNKSTGIVGNMLFHCIGTMKGAYQGQTAPFNDLKYPPFPINHLSFTGVRNQFVYDERKPYEQSDKLRYYSRYASRQAEMQEKNIFYVPQKLVNEFWEFLGDDAEYLVPLLDSQVV